MSSVHSVTGQSYAASERMQSSQKIHSANDPAVKNALALQSQVTVAMLKQTMEAEKAMAMQVLDMLA